MARSSETIEQQPLTLGRSRDIDVAPTFALTEELSVTIQSMQDLVLEQDRLAGIHAIVGKLSEPPKVNSTESLALHLQSHERTLFEFEMSSEHVNVLTQLEPLGQSLDTEPLHQFVSVLTQSLGEAINTKDTLNEVTQAWEVFEKLTADWLDTDPLCQTCGAKLSKDNIRYPAHQHK